uniref:Chitin-binding type-2 domain-containing protein n=1 Tax=Stomoxys calcitrans TaxID=35570 RepID=A0A1I8PI12_STOCA
MSVIQPQNKSSYVGDNVTLMLAEDSELSASERTRRLIPYMAFYVPIQELPINQQYTSVQTPKHVARPSATGSSGSHSIQLPPQYVHLKSTAVSGVGSGTESGPTSYLQSSPAAPHYQASAGDAYHTLTRGGTQQIQPQYQLPPTPIKHHSDNSGSNKYPDRHLLSHGLPGPSAPNTANLAGVKLNPIRHKTVQHFPPLTSQSAATSQLSTSAYEAPSSTSSEKYQHHGIAYRPRTKQSKINLTPFTPANSVPGNFVPIVYTPVNSNNNNYNNIVLTSQGAASVDTINSYNVPTNTFNGGAKQQQIAIEYSHPLVQSITETPLQSYRPPQQPHHQVHHDIPKQQDQQYLSVTSPASQQTGSETGTSGGSTHQQNTQTTGAVGTYTQQIEELQLQHQNRPKQLQKFTLIRSKQQQADQPYGTKFTHFTPSKIENLFDFEQHQEQDGQVEQPTRYNDKQQYYPYHQQQKEQQHTVFLTKPKYRESVHQQPTHIIVLSPTAATNDALSQAHSGKYALASGPIRQPSYTRPEQSSVSSPGQQEIQNIEASSTPVQSNSQLPFEEQILTIPVHNLFSDLRNYQHIHYAPSSPSQPLVSSLNYNKIGGQSAQQYSDVSVNDPKQALDDEQNETYKKNIQQQRKQTLRPPPQAFIEVMTTAAPFHQPIIQENYVSTSRPLHKPKHNAGSQTPKEEKNPNYPTIRQPNPMARPLVTVTSTPHTMIMDSAPKYVYVEEEFGQKLSAGSIKLKPVDKYGHNKQTDKHPGPSTGRPGIDYPNYSEIPQTSFDCSEQRYKGFFGDPETNCQVWHYCDLNGGKASFLCPNGTIFSQIALTCDWWFNVKCATTAQLYVLNERLYKYILPFTPKFPEDYSGPLVDKYLAMKFHEMEEKMRLERKQALENQQENEQNHELPLEDTKEETRLEDTTKSTMPIQKPVESSMQKHDSINSQVSEQSSERNLLIDDEVDDISHRGSMDTFEVTTLETDTTKDLPFSLKPIIVSSTAGPAGCDEEEQQQHQQHDDAKRRTDQELETNKTEANNKPQKEIIAKIFEKHISPSIANTKTDLMKITVEKVDVIEIKPDGNTDHLIRKMIQNNDNK